MKALLRTACDCTKVIEVRSPPPPDLRIPLSFDPLHSIYDPNIDLPQVEITVRIFKLHGRYHVPGTPEDVAEYREIR